MKEVQRWTSFYVAEEGVRPALAVEVTSPQAMSVDLVDKKGIYEQARVPLYVIVETDPQKGTRAFKLIGYQLTSDGYVEMAANERGWLWLEPVRLFIGIRDEKVECYDAGGTRLGSYEEVTAALMIAEEAQRDAEALAASEKEALLEAEARIRDLEEQIRRLQGGS